MIKKAKLIIATIMTALVVVGMPAYAQSNSQQPQSIGPQKCGSTTTQIIKCNDGAGIGAIGDLIKFAISMMTILIGVVAVGGLAYAGIVYTSARDDQSKVSEAKNIIRNVVIGLIMYGFTIAIINYLLPSSVISGDSTPSPSPSVSNHP